MTLMQVDLNDCPTCEQAFRQALSSFGELPPEQEQDLVEKARSGGKEERDEPVAGTFRARCFVQPGHEGAQIPGILCQHLNARVERHHH